jgi:hypothetical protein
VALLGCGALVSWFGACSSTESSRGPFATTSGAPDSSTGDDDGAASDEGAGADEGQEDGPGILFDTPDGNSGGQDEGGETEGCEGVDLLFVIDNSPSMENDIVNLINSFPGFVAGIEGAINLVSDFHIGVTTTDDTFQQPGLDPTCQGLGTLIEHSAGGYCGPYSSGYNYFTGADDIASAFACAATQGSQGSASERPIDSASLALSQDFNGPGGCNDGFLRDDALLVVVIITDEDDSYSAGVPDTWYADFIDLKDGLEDNLVVLSILMGPGAPPECNVNWNGPGTDLTTFTQKFENGYVGDICQPDFTPFFQQAVGHVQEAFTECHPLPEG